MFDISVLKEMKLHELLVIAKLAKTIKYNGVKKDELINQILIHQAENDDAEPIDKPKRSRIPSEKKAAIKKPVVETLFSEPVEEKKEEIKAEISIEEPILAEKKSPKITKFNKAEYDKKLAIKAEKLALNETVNKEET